MTARGGRVWIGNLRPGISRPELKHVLEEITGIEGLGIALFHKNGGADSRAIVEVPPAEEAAVVQLLNGLSAGISSGRLKARVANTPGQVAPWTETGGQRPRGSIPAAPRPIDARPVITLRGGPVRGSVGTQQQVLPGRGVALAAAPRHAAPLRAPAVVQPFPGRAAAALQQVRAGGYETVSTWSPPPPSIYPAPPWQVRQAMQRISRKHKMLILNTFRTYA